MNICRDENIVLYFEELFSKVYKCYTVNAFGVLGALSSNVPCQIIISCDVFYFFLFYAQMIIHLKITCKSLVNNHINIHLSHSLLMGIKFSMLWTVNYKQKQEQ